MLGVGGAAHGFIGVAPRVRDAVALLSVRVEDGTRDVNLGGARAGAGAGTACHRAYVPWLAAAALQVLGRVRLRAGEGHGVGPWAGARQGRGAGRRQVAGPRLRCAGKERREVGRRCGLGQQEEKEWREEEGFGPRE